MKFRLCTRVALAALALLALPLLAAVAPARAWSAGPHMITAEVARRYLSAQGGDRADAALAALSQWFPDTSDFVRTAAWADNLKFHSVLLFNEWHYVDQWLLAEDPAKAPPADVLERLRVMGQPIKARADPGNVIWALEKCREVFRDKDATSWSRSTSLRLVIHFMGDIHQPLHTARYYSQGCPGGDFGGNTICVLDGNYHTNLHHLMDSGADRFPNTPHHDDLFTPEGQKWVREQADSVIAEHPLSSFDNAAVVKFAPESWANESHSIAVDQIYRPLEHRLGSSLNCSASWCRTPDTDQRITMSGADMERMGGIVSTRVALGGYRLAHLVTGLMMEHDPPAGEGPAPPCPAPGGHGHGDDSGGHGTIAWALAIVFGCVALFSSAALVVTMRRLEDLKRVSNNDLQAGAGAGASVTPYTAL